MLYISVFKRVPKTEMSINLIPFWSIGAIQSGLIETLYEKIFNVLFFVPYGCLLGTYFRHKTFMKAVVLGVATSVGIELIQLLTHTGTCEIDDVICNTFGCVIGTGTVITCKKIYEKFFLL
ncbi:MAG: VanZ family protein [Alistipes sp.]|nr:VanZ family protein [Candidatus Alistipes equi]